MKWTRLESEALRTIAYHPEAQRLEIRFQDGSAYEYREVPAPAYAALLQAESRGRQFNAAIRGRYPWRRLPGCKDANPGSV
jgi:hypothetical protein